MDRTPELWETLPTLESTAHEIPGGQIQRTEPLSEEEADRRFARLLKNLDK